MHGHLVAVEVGVEGGAGKGMELDGPALHQHRLEGLDAQAVQGRRTVQEHGVILDHVLENAPDLGGTALHHALGALHVLSVAQLNQLLHDEGLEELQGHLLGKAALAHLQVRTDHDDGTAGVVHALAQQVLTEPALLAAEHVGQGLEGAVARARHGAGATAVVDEGVHRLLQHPLLVADDDIGGAELQEPLQPVVPVDDPAIQIVEVAGGEPAAVQLDHGPKIRGDHRHSGRLPLLMKASTTSRRFTALVCFWPPEVSISLRS